MPARMSGWQRLARQRAERALNNNTMWITNTMRAPIKSICRQRKTGFHTSSREAARTGRLCRNHHGDTHQIRWKTRPWMRFYFRDACSQCTGDRHPLFCRHEDIFAFIDPVNSESIVNQLNHVQIVRRDVFMRMALPVTAATPIKLPTSIKSAPMVNSVPLRRSTFEL